MTILLRTWATTMGHDLFGMIWKMLYSNWLYIIFVLDIILPAPMFGYFIIFISYQKSRSFFALRYFVNSSFSLECNIRSCWMLNSNCKICCIVYMMSNLMNARISLASPELTYRLISKFL